MRLLFLFLLNLFGISIHFKMTKNIPFRWIAIAISASTVLALSACVKDLKIKKIAGIEWNPEFAVPLVYSSITAKDVMVATYKGGSLTEDQDHFITLVYRGNLLSLTAADFVKFPDQSVNNSLDITSASALLLNTPGTVSIPFSQNITLSTGSGGSRIDTLYLKSGMLKIQVESDIDNNGSIAISIPGATKNGIAFSATLPLTYNGGSVTTSTVQADLSGYRIVTSSPAPPDNQLQINCNMTFTGASGSATAGDQIRFTESFSNLQFSKLYGYINQPLLSPNADTVLVDLFNNSIGGGTFTLADPKFRVFITNSYGLPILANFGLFQGYNQNRTPSTYNILGAGIPNPLPIGSPTIQQIGQSILTNFELNKDNSNIVDIINNTPPYVIYQINALANPAGVAPPSAPNFVLDTSNFKVDMEIEMPLYGTAKGFTVQDTVESFTFEDATHLDYLLLRTSIDNGFPCDVKIQVYFTDSVFNKLDSLVTGSDPIILSAAPVDANGRVSAPSSKTTDVVLEKERISKLNKLKYMLVKADASTNNNGQTNVRIYSDYSLAVKIGADAKVNFTINPNGQ